MGFFDFLTEEIAIDLGTANTLIIHNDKVVVDSPSIVARNRLALFQLASILSISISNLYYYYTALCVCV